MILAIKCATKKYEAKALEYLRVLNNTGLRNS